MPDQAHRRLNVQLDALVREAEHTIPKPFKSAIPPLIRGLPTVVRSAVHFHHQPRRWRVKVAHVELAGTIPTGVRFAAAKFG
jgi:hypothetical protein